MSEKNVYRVRLMRWGESSSTGRTVTFRLPDDGDEHPFKGLPIGAKNGQMLEMEIAIIDGDDDLKSLGRNKSSKARSDEKLPTIDAAEAEVLVSESATKTSSAAKGKATKHESDVSSGVARKATVKMHNLSRRVVKAEGKATPGEPSIPKEQSDPSPDSEMNVSESAASLAAARLAARMHRENAAKAAALEKSESDEAGTAPSQPTQHLASQPPMPAAYSTQQPMPPHQNTQPMPQQHAPSPQPMQAQAPQATQQSVQPHASPSPTPQPHIAQPAPPPSQGSAPETAQPVSSQLQSTATPSPQPQDQAPAPRPTDQPGWGPGPGNGGSNVNLDEYAQQMGQAAEVLATVAERMDAQMEDDTPQFPTAPQDTGSEGEHPGQVAVRRATSLCKAIDKQRAGFFYFMRSRYLSVTPLPGEGGDWSHDAKSTRDRVCAHCETDSLSGLLEDEDARRKFEALETKFERSERLR